MLRSIMTAALVGIPNVVIEEWSGDIESGTEDLFRRMRTSRPDVLIFKHRNPHRSEDFQTYLQEFPGMKFLVIDERGESGCVYTLNKPMVYLNELTISVLVNALDGGSADRSH